jgi:hypothetical protein
MYKSIRIDSLDVLQLARFADSILKKSQRNLSESEQEEKMNDIVSCRNSRFLQILCNISMSLENILHSDS